MSTVCFSVTFVSTMWQLTCPRNTIENEDMIKKLSKRKKAPDTVKLHVPRSLNRKTSYIFHCKFN